MILKFTSYVSYHDLDHDLFGNLQFYTIITQTLINIYLKQQQQLLLILFNHGYKIHRLFGEDCIRKLHGLIA